MSQEGLPRARPGRHIVITITALKQIWEYASQGASAHLPQEQWRMSKGMLFGRVWGDTFRVEEAFGLGHGTLTRIELHPDAYGPIDAILGWNEQRMLSVGGWYLTRPLRGVYLSDIEVTDYIFYQYPNPDAFVLVFDHTAMGPASLGFKLYRIDDLTVPSWKMTSHEVLDFTLEGVTLEALTEAVNLFQNPHFTVESLWEAIKPRVSPTPPPLLPEIPRSEPRPKSIQTKRRQISVPKAEDLTAKDLAYYRQTWGFDPVKDRVKVVEKGYFYYETRLPLVNDPALNDAGVQLVGRLELDFDGVSHNRIGFERGDKRSLVECIHTAIYDATLEELAEFSPEDYEELVGSTEGRPEVLPPWEHFASLKSFAAGLVDQGILATLFEPPAGSFSDESGEDEGEDEDDEDEDDEDVEDQGWGLNGIFEQLINALEKIAPEIVKSQVTERLGEIIERAPEDWIKTHAEPLFMRYKVDLLYENAAYLASVDNSMLKKLLVLHLCLAREDFPVVERGTYEAFLSRLGEGNFLEGLNPETTIDLVDAIYDEIGAGGDRTKLDHVLEKIFLVLLAREDALLLDPSFLDSFLMIISDPLNEDSFPVFAKNIHEDYLFKLLGAIFRFWEKESDPNLGNTPYLVMRYFLEKGNNYDLLRKFILLAPEKWIVEYWPLLENQFNLKHVFLTSSGAVKAVDMRVRKKIASIIAHSTSNAK